MMRVFQIRMQVRPVADSLSGQWIANRLELTDDQKQKLAQVSQEMRTKQMELIRSMREAGEGQRGEIWQKMGELRRDADQKAVAVLTDEQKTSFEEMKGEKFEFQMRRPG